MAFIPVTGGGEAVVKMSIGSIPIINVFGVLVPANPMTSAYAISVNDDLVSAYAELVPFFTDTMTIDEVIITDLQTVTGPQYTYAPSTPGEQTGDALPFQTAALVSWQTDTRGRSFRGRSYLGVFTENKSSGRTIASDLLDAIDAFAQAIVDSTKFGVISRFDGVDPDTHEPIVRDPHIITPITTFTHHPNWRTQRRRALASG